MHVYKLDPEIALIIRPSIADQTGTRGTSHPRCLRFARIAAIRRAKIKCVRSIHFCSLPVSNLKEGKALGMRPHHSHKMVSSIYLIKCHRLVYPSECR